MTDEAWKPGLPPGKYYPGMESDFEVRFTPGGAKWYRPRHYTGKAADHARQADSARRHLQEAYPDANSHGEVIREVERKP